MSWLFSQALVAEYSAASCWDGAPFAPLSVMPTQHKLWRNDKPMAHSRFSQFGQTSVALTADHGEELLMWFREASLARTSPLQETVAVSKATARSLEANGENCQ